MQTKRAKRILICLFILYILAMLLVLFGRPVKHDHYWNRWQLMRYQFQLEPLRTIGRYLRTLRAGVETSIFPQLIVELVGNTLLFVPMGFFLPVLFRGMRHPVRTQAMIFLLVLAVELTQVLLLVGTFDVDDIILNNLGAPVGYLVYWALLGKGER